MSDNSVQITGRCQPPAESGKFLVPQQGTGISKKRVLVIAANGSEKVLKPGTRADSGPGACVNAGILAALGGEDAIVSYRGLSFAGAVRRDSALRLAFAVMLLTAVSTAATATVSWVKNTADSNDIVVNAAPIVAFLSFASAALKLWKDYNDL